MNNIINSNDSPTVVVKKLTVFELKNMMLLKKHCLWWKEDEKKFIKKYGFSSDHKNLKMKTIEYLNKIREEGEK